ncbi:DUF397 domain-containing protein [Actinomadura sp. 6N118]|uniref:DUF397 domain-containing protein n=1 Tax=Actinomadura sp. 6N118 TaxID=3375151 RepID=UPI0037AC255E
MTRRLRSGWNAGASRGRCRCSTPVGSSGRRRWDHGGDQVTAKWRKSSRSEGSQDGACVELANLGAVVGVRASKAPESGHLPLSTGSFAALVARVKRAELDL